MPSGPDEVEAYIKSLEQKGSSPVDSFGDRALKAAKEDHDWDVLAEYLEKKGEVTPDIREFLVAILRKEAKRPNRRPRNAAAILVPHLEIAAFVFDRKQNGEKYPIQQAAKFFRRDSRFVHRAVKSYPNLTEKQAAFVLSGSPRTRASWCARCASLTLSRTSCRMQSGEVLPLVAPGRPL
jgi:hypothetical protein